MGLSEILGPGIWFTIHLKAFMIKDVFDYKDFIKYLYLLSFTFPCDNCKGHFKTYLLQYPPENEYGKNYKISDNITCNGLFYWTIVFHNSVNVRLGKKEEKAIDVYNKYVSSFTKECDDKCSYVPEGNYNDYINGFKENRIKGVPF